MTTRRHVLGGSIALAATPFLPHGVAAQAPPGQFTQSGLVGRLQGPTLASTIPTTFHEAPQLAELVKQGKLPPVTQRLPAEPMVIQPLEGPGRYGGIWRRAFIGPGDGENGNRLVASDKPLFWDYTGNTIAPAVARGFELSADGRSTTILLRRGMKWSDGAPFTADDFMFWFDDLYGNKDIVPSPIPEMSAGGKPGRMVKVDETTIRFEFEAPHLLFPSMLAGDTLIGGGQAARQSGSGTFGAYAPAHYLKQFLPKYSSEAEANRRAREAGFDNWVRMLKVRHNWAINPELPTLGPWRTSRAINTPTWAMERNPYYYAVDTDGNQLPYLDAVVMTLAENTEIVNLRAMAGEYDLQERHIDLAKLPIILENRERGKYDVHLDLAFNGADTALHFNLNYTADPEIGRLLSSADFRRALSLGIDRDQLNETFWLGLATPGCAAPADSIPESPGPEWRKTWSVLDIAQANAMLDTLGLTKKDRDGYRLRTDNGQRLVIQITVTKAFLDWPAHSQMIAQQWKKIGIFADVRDQERALAFQRVLAGEHHIFVFANTGSEQLFLYPHFVLPVDIGNGVLGVDLARWYASNGAIGTRPADPLVLKTMEMFRSTTTLPEAERNRLAQEIWKIAIDQQFSIGICGQSPAFAGVRLVNRRLGNIPERACIAQHCRTPASSHPTTWFFRA